VNSSGRDWVAHPRNSESIGGNEYNCRTSGAATLLIDSDIKQTNVS